MKYFLTKASTNRKTGPIPVATISKLSCPTSCPLAEAGCYADGGPLRIHWNQITNGEKGTDFEQFTEQISKLPRRQLWRYAQAGDLPGEGDRIDATQLDRLATVNRGRPVIAFTHKPPTSDNLASIRAAQAKGFTINLSADDVKIADEYSKLDLPVVVVLHSAYARKARGTNWTETIGEYKQRTRSFPKHTPDGNRIAVCPATYIDTQCSQCEICSHADRNGVIVGFPAHGNRKGVMDAKLTMNNST